VQTVLTARKSSDRALVIYCVTRFEPNIVGKLGHNRAMVRGQFTDLCSSQELRLRMCAIANATPMSLLSQGLGNDWFVLGLGTSRLQLHTSRIAIPTLLVPRHTVYNSWETMHTELHLRTRAIANATPMSLLSQGLGNDWFVMGLGTSRLQLHTSRIAMPSLLVPRHKVYNSWETSRAELLLPLGI